MPRTPARKTQSLFLRIDPKLHKRLDQERRRRRVSLREFCESILAAALEEEKTFEEAIVDSQAKPPRKPFLK